MKKVLFVSTISGNIAGFQMPYLKLFKDNGWETQVAVGDTKHEIDNCDKLHLIKISRNPLKTSNLNAINELKNIIIKEKIDLISCHTPMGGVVARIAAKVAKKTHKTRVVYTAHGFHFYKGAPLKNWLIYYPIEWYLSKYTDTLITINKEDYNFAKIKFSKRCKDIQYVPGVGIDTTKFSIEMTKEELFKFRESIGLKENDFVLSCVARLDKNKNQVFLINVTERLVKQYKNIHLLLIGPDELNGYYQRIVEEKKLNNHVHFLGRRTDIPQLLKISNVVVSASKREGLPVNVQEAMASAIPVVALECRGMNDLIEDGKNGYVLDQNDIDRFIERISKLYKDKELRLKISKNGVEAVKKYDIQNVIKEYKMIYIENNEV